MSGYSPNTAQQIDTRSPEPYIEGFGNEVTSFVQKPANTRVMPAMEPAAASLNFVWLAWSCLSLLSAPAMSSAVGKGYFVGSYPVVLSMSPVHLLPLLCHWSQVTTLPVSSRSLIALKRSWWSSE